MDMERDVRILMETAVMCPDWRIDIGNAKSRRRHRQRLAQARLAIASFLENFVPLSGISKNTTIAWRIVANTENGRE